MEGGGWARTSSAGNAIAPLYHVAYAAYKVVLLRGRGPLRMYGR